MTLCRIVTITTTETSPKPPIIAPAQQHTRCIEMLFALQRAEHTPYSLGSPPEYLKNLGFFLF